MVHLRIVESKRINERTYNVGDAQYWKRNGKCYKWTQSQGKVEISEDDYYKSLSGTSSKDTKPSDNKKSINTVNHGNDSTIDYDYNKKESTLKFNNYEYKVTPKDTSMSVDDVVKHYANIAKHSNGRAMQWLKQNANLERINKKQEYDPENTTEPGINKFKEVWKTLSVNTHPNDVEYLINQVGSVNHLNKIHKLLGREDNKDGYPLKGKEGINYADASNDVKNKIVKILNDPDAYDVQII